MLRWLLLGIEAVIALPVLYLCLVSLSALLETKRRSKQTPVFSPPSAYFALLIPAHNENAVLGTLLRSLRAGI